MSAVLAALLVVVVSVVGYRLSDTTRPYALVSGRLDQPARFQSGHLVVSDVRVGGRLRERDDVQTSPGVFVAVHLAVRADGDDSVQVGDLQVRSGERTYPPFDDAQFVGAAVGFQTSTDVVFEVDPADLDDLRIECFDRGIVYRYYPVVQVALGTTGLPADAERDAEVTVSTSPESRVVS